MDRIYQVFVSSTFVDLKEERQAVVTALLELEAMPAGMELFPAADDDAWTLIEQVISACDYYLLVIGGRYGSVDAETELSFTEREFNFAVAEGKPVMAFLHGEPEKIEQGRSEQEEPEKLQAFRRKVEESKHVKFWTSPEDLAGKVARSFSTFRKNYPAIGWVRGDAVTSSESLKELNALRKELEVTQLELNAARTSPPPGSGDLSQGPDELNIPLFARGSAAGEVVSVRAEFITAVTWDELFSKLGPLLLDECEEERMRERLDSYFRVKRKDEAIKALATENDVNASFSDVDVSLPFDTFGTLMVQFKALGLIEKSEKKRSVSDNGTYWTLTAFGDNHLTSLRAIPRSLDIAAVQTKETNPQSADASGFNQPREEDEAEEGQDEDVVSSVVSGD